MDPTDQSLASDFATLTAQCEAQAAQKAQEEGAGNGNGEGEDKGEVAKLCNHGATLIADRLRSNRKARSILSRHLTFS